MKHFIRISIILGVALSCFDRPKVQEGFKITALPLVYADTGFVVTYHDSTWNLIFDSSAAKFMRHAYYVSGEIDSTKTVIGFYKRSQWKQFEGRIKRGRPDGLVRWYYDSSGVKSERNYKNGEVDGGAKEYYFNGAPKLDAQFKNGLLHGKFRSFYENGSIKENIRYENGQRHGQCLSYYENGVLERKERYKYGAKDGHCLEYYSNSNLKMSSRRSLGQFHGHYSEYYENGKKKIDGYYKDGQQRGTWTYYDSNGGYTRYEYLPVRMGAVCNDGTESTATGRGACSWHGGVNYWLIDYRRILTGHKD